jgi:DNA-binding transcriptional ArsR family regulator
MPHLPHLFQALADPTRFAIVERLLAEGELPVARLKDGLTISAPAVSRHLNVLSDAGLLARRAQGQQRFYSVRPEAMREISDWTISHAVFWQASLDRLAAAILKEDFDE